MTDVARVQADNSMRAPHEATPPLLELRGISKSFPGVKALDDVSFAVEAGEVHMLLGENGAGKSSLIKVLCGAYAPDAGVVLHRGEPVAMRSPADARGLGIAVIFPGILARSPPRYRAEHLFGP